MREVWLVEAANDVTRVSVQVWEVDVESKTYADFTTGAPLHCLGDEDPPRNGGTAGLAGDMRVELPADEPCRQRRPGHGYRPRLRLTCVKEP